mmetsp:Transcript_11895/g.27602  ORF Transcript_11895/g.27602 Transcript_11895/m.27602 type:complete len:318 (-) Transcript_11895:573-1526(-)
MTAIHPQYTHPVQSKRQPTAARSRRGSRGPLLARSSPVETGCRTAIPTARHCGGAVKPPPSLIHPRSQFTRRSQAPITPLVSRLSIASAFYRQNPLPRGILIGHVGLRAGRVGSSRDDLASVHQLLAEIVDRLADALVHRHLRLPSDLGLRDRDVGLALARVVLGGRHVDDGGVRVGEFVDHRREVLNGILIGVAEVHGHVIVAIHQLHEPVDEVVDVLERARLRALAVDGHRLALQRLNDEVAHDAPIVRVHARAESVEDAGNSHVNPLLLLVRVHHRLRHAFALVIARTRTNRVHVTPVRLRLRVDLRIAVDLRG